jgi:pimeloyl-ACP methyl ester carboxylesterase
MTTTRILETDEVSLAFDVHGLLPTMDSRPPLFMIGQPMTADGFTTFASHFSDRSVVTYDPRGHGGSTLKDGRADDPPTVQACDVHAVIQELNVGAVEMFASSGGAVTALELVTGFPDDVTTLVAHEPPLIPVLPDAPPPRAPAPASGTPTKPKVGRRHGGLHRDDVLAGRIHRRLLRPAHPRSSRVQPANRR